MRKPFGGGEKTSIRKRPELVTLPSVPKILKISEIPTGVWVMRINMPFTFTHLAQKGVKQAFVYINTGKTMMTFLAEHTARIAQMKRELKELFNQKFPLIGKHMHVNITAQLVFGNKRGRTRAAEQSMFSPYYVADVPKLMQELDECGFSKLPIQMFQIPIENPRVWVTFTRRAHYQGFVLTQIGSKLCTGNEGEEYLTKLIRDNEILEKLGCHLCQTSEVTGKFQTCKV